MTTREEAIAYFKRHLDLYCVDGISREAEEMAIKALEERKVGKWVTKSHGFPPELTTVCSECSFDRDFYIHPRGFDKIKYCPNCGAKMTESEVNQ